MAYDWMQRPVSGTSPNNFEQTQVVGKNRLNAMWGDERFTITTTVDRASGKILHATMTNQLKLMLRVECDPAFQACGPEFPFTITRKETLTLVPG